MILRCSRQEIGIIRAALSAHREKLEPAIRLASRAKDTEHLTTLMGERKATTQMIQELDRKDHPSASITSIDA